MTLTGGGGIGLWSRGAILVSAQARVGIRCERKGTHGEEEAAESSASNKYRGSR